MLEAAISALRDGRLPAANALIDSVQRALDNGGQFIDPLAASYWNLVLAATDLGYTVQGVELNLDRAVITGYDGRTAELKTVRFVLDGREWVYTN